MIGLIILLIKIGIGIVVGWLALYVVGMILVMFFELGDVRGENVGLQTGREVDIPNRINSKTGKYDPNVPITRILNQFSGKKENSIDRGLFRINNKRFYDILNDRRPGFRDAMFNVGLIDDLHKGGKGLTSEVVSKYWDRMLDPEKNIKMAKVIFDIGGWAGWFAAPPDLL